MVSLFVGQLCIFLHVSLLFLVGLRVVNILFGRLIECCTYDVNPRDMKHLMFDISNYQGMIEVQFALKIAAYTFVRPSELRFSRWNELEGDIWRMPAERTKLKRGRLVPLSTQVKTLTSSPTCPLSRFLESLKSALVKNKWVKTH